MIFFLDRTGPVRLRQSPPERIRSLLLTLCKRFKSRYGGALGVEQNLRLELERQSRFFWTAGNGSIPDRPVDVAWAVSSVHDLAFALTLKKMGLAKKVWGGPNLIVVPEEAGELLGSEMLDTCIVPCAWTADFYARQEPRLKSKLAVWPVGIDTTYWKDTFDLAKNTLLIYNKNQSEMAKTIAAHARIMNLQTRTIDYGSYSPQDYRDALASASGMVWLSASESQGLACLEALSMDVPVLAWDRGRWDYEIPKTRRAFTCKATSVPYFDKACGDTFKDMNEFPAALTRFSSQLPLYQPREWLLRQHLDLETNLSLLTPLQSL